MRPRLAAGAALLLLGTLSGARPAHAHRLDEYLQAAMIALAKDRVRVQLRLTPGIAVFPDLLAGIDTNADGILSDVEGRAYAERVRRDLSLAIDGTRLPLRLVASQLASIAEMKAGRGDIVLDLEAVVPNGGGDRRLTFENRHRTRIAVYLVNTLVPRDPDIQVTAQRRSYEQSSYRLDYTQAGAASSALSLAAWTGVRGWLVMAALLPLAWLVSRRQARARRGAA